MEIWTKFIDETWELALEMAPYLWIGFIAAGAIRIWLRPETAQRLLGGRGWIKNIQATVIGIPLPVCSCGIVPIAAGLRKFGAGPGPTLSFMTATPQTGVDSILATWGMMGPFFAVFRVITAFVSGIVTGSFVDIFAPNHPTDREHENSKSSEAEKQNQRSEHGREVGLGCRIREGLHYSFVDLPEDIGKSILIGLLLSGVLSTFIPEQYLDQYMAQPWLAYLAVSLFAVPLYVCSTGSIPLAVALVKGGISPGAALVFLMLGPATNTVTLSAIWKLLGPRRLFLYLIALVSVAWAAGLALDMWAPQSWTPAAIEHEHGTSDQGWNVELTFQWIAALGLMGVILFPWGRNMWKRLGSFFRSQDDSGQELTSDNQWRALTFDVAGITCGNCAKKIQNRLGEQKWMRNISADPDKNEVYIETRLKDPLSIMQSQLDDLGFETKGIK